MNENDIVRLKPISKEPLERKIYSNWAFTDSASEKCKINEEIYRELCANTKISYDIKNMPEEAELILSVEHCALHNKYKVYKNTKNLTADQIAPIVDNGNLCFGYSGTTSDGKVWID